MMGGRPPTVLRCAKLVVVNPSERRPSAMQAIRFGLDLAKAVFQVHGVDGAERVVVQRRLRRSQVVSFFARQEPALIGLEACGSA